MALPTWTYETDDLSTGYSESSSPTYQDDQHNLNTGVGTDGTDDNIYRAGVVASGATEFVVSLWVKPTAIPPSSRPTIIGQDNGVGSQQFNIYYDSTQHFGAYAWDNSANTWTNTETSATSAIDTWYHLIMVASASDVRLYVNGAIPSYSVDSVAGPSGHFASAGTTVPNLQIGSRQSGGLFFQGEHSRPKILTGGTITALQATELYNNEVAAIDETIPTSKYLDLTVSPFTANGSPTETEDQHNLSSTYDFDAVNDYLSTAVEPISDGTELFTVGIWIKKDADSTTQFFVNQRPTSGSGFYYNFGFDTSNRIRCVLQGGVDNIVKVSTETVTVADGWTHIAVSVDVPNTTTKIYKNGVETSYAISTTAGTPPSSVTVSTLAIGSLYSDSFATGLSGIASRAKFWDGTELTSAQVLAEYDAEVLAYAVPSATFEDLDLSDGWTESGGPTYVVDQHSASTVAFVGDGVNNINNINDGITDGSGAKQAISFWTKFTTPGSASFPIAQRNASVATENAFDINFDAANINVNAWTNASDRTSSQATYAANPIDDGQWHLVTISLSSGTVGIYTDGTVVTYNTQDSDLGSGYSGVPASGIADLSIGNIINGSFYFNGEISRVKVWSGVGLTATQVALEYTAECEAVVVPTADLRSTNLNDTGSWTLTGTPTAVDDQHNPQAAIDFDAVDDKATLVAGSVIEVNQTTFTGSCWVKNDGQTAYETIMCQYAATGQQMFVRWGYHAGTGYDGSFEVYAFENGTASSRRVITDAIGYDDGEWHHLIFSIGNDGGQYNEFVVDGVELTGITVLASGFNKFGGTLSNYTLGDTDDGAVNKCSSVLTRPVAWNERLSVCQMKKEYANEVAAIGEGFVTAGGDNSLFTSALFANKLYSRLSSKLYTQ